MKASELQVDCIYITGNEAMVVVEAGETRRGVTLPSGTCLQYQGWRGEEGRQLCAFTLKSGIGAGLTALVGSYILQRLQLEPCP